MDQITEKLLQYGLAGVGLIYLAWANNKKEKENLRLNKVLFRQGEKYSESLNKVVTQYAVVMTKVQESLKRLAGK